MNLGDRLDGKFVLVSRLGAGRFSEVFRGTTLGAHSQPVAIKILKDPMDDALTREVFEREVESLRSLRHENIVEFLGSGQTPDARPYLATEFCDKSIAPLGRWDSSLAVEFVEALLLALQQAHGDGIVHRDLKPQHLLRKDPDGPIKVIDFGISSIRRRLPTGVTLAGHFTPGYACADQMAGRPSRPQFDLYAVAACSLWFLAGRAPDSEIGLATQLKDLSGVPKAFREFLKSLTNVDDQTLTAGTALRRLHEISANWRATEEHRLILTHDLLRSLSLHWDLNGDVVAACTRVSEDLSPVHGVYPYLAAAKGASDRVAFQGYSYRLMGRNYLWRMTVHQSGRAFTVSSFEGLSPDELDAHRQTGIEMPIDWFVTPPAQVDSSFRPVEAVCCQLIDFEARKADEWESTRSRIEMVEGWENVFRLQRQLLANPASLTDYTDFEEDGDLLRVKVTLGAVQPNLWRPEEPLSMTSSESSEPVSVGRFAGRAHDRVLVRRDDNRAIRELAHRGRIGPDRGLAYAALRRQQDALFVVRKGTAVNPLLSEVLCGLREPEVPDPSHVTDWVQSALDPAKQKAVELALGTNDVVLIQGPPGTGKTVAIAELVLQILKREPQSKILLVSQSNVALDQALEKIAGADADVLMTRIARDEDKVSDYARPWILRHKTLEWRERVLAKSKSYLDSLIPDASQNLSVSSARQLLADLVGLQTRTKALAATRMPILGMIAAEQRRGEDRLDSETREELALVDEELQKCREDREVALDLLKEFFDSRHVVVEGEPESWSIALDGIGAAEALRPESRLAALWDEWRRQFGRGLPYEAALARRARVLAGTCLGSAWHPSVSRGEFDWVICDESGRATSPELMVPLVRARRAVLVYRNHKI